MIAPRGLGADRQRRQARGGGGAGAARRAARRLVGVGRAAAPGRRATSSPRHARWSRKFANSVTFVLPRMIAPAARSLATTRRVARRASSSAARSSRPWSAARPTSRLSLTSTGMPCSGPRDVPAARSASSAAASSSAFGLSDRGRPGSPGPRRWCSAIRAQVRLRQRRPTSACRRSSAPAGSATDSVSSENGSVGAVPIAPAARGRVAGAAAANGGAGSRAAVHARVDLARPAGAASSPARTRSANAIRLRSL